jgi:hypothetical protein
VHFVIPLVSSLILIPVLLDALGVKTSLFKFVSSLPYPINRAGIVVIIWFALGIIYLGYLWVAHRDRVIEMSDVFE